MITIIHYNSEHRDIKMEIEDKIFRILREFNQHSVDLRPNSELINDLGLDSLSFTQLLTIIESEMSIEIKQNELTEQNFSTIENFIRYVKRKMRGESCH